MKRITLGILTLATVLAPVFAGPTDSAWTQMFRPDDLTLSDWTPKFTSRALGVNQNGVFRNAKLADSTTRVLHVYQTQTFANTGFGHLFYNKRPYSHYIIRAEYRFPDSTSTFTASQGDWTVQNNGLMLHSQAPNTMGYAQDFPISLEAQLLGPKNTGADNNSSMNLCTPGTAFYTAPTGGSVQTTHCISATTVTRPAYPIWAVAQARMYGADSAYFYVGSARVLSFYRAVVYAGNVSGDSAVLRPANNTVLAGGYITIQDEGTSTEFRKIEILNLAGCMTPTDLNYKTYFVKHDSTECGKPAALTSANGSTLHFAISGNQVLAETGILQVEVRDLRGSLVSRIPGNGALSVDLGILKPGIYSVGIRTARGNTRLMHGKL